MEYCVGALAKIAMLRSLHVCLHASSDLESLMCYINRVHLC